MRIVIYTGTGLSAESGIPAVSDADGIWQRYDTRLVCTHPVWKDHVQEACAFYEELYAELQHYQPNAAHRAIAELARHYDVTVITPTIDTLLEAAGVPKVWHLHGTVGRIKCEWHWSIIVSDQALARTPYGCDYRVQAGAAPDFGAGCPRCGGRMRPDIVLFGERVDGRPDDVAALTRTTELFVAVGTPADVQSAAGLIDAFSQTPQRAYVSPAAAASLPEGFTPWIGPASRRLPELVSGMLAASRP
jgi:NAD-dependent deacetylase